MAGRLIVAAIFMFRYPPDPAGICRYTPHGVRAILERHGFEVDDSILVLRLPLRGARLFQQIFAISSQRVAGWPDDAANAGAVARRPD